MNASEKHPLSRAALIAIVGIWLCTFAFIFYTSAQTERRNAERWFEAARENAQRWAETERANAERWARLEHANAERWREVRERNAVRWYRTMRSNLELFRDKLRPADYERLRDKIDNDWRAQHGDPLPDTL